MKLALIALLALLPSLGISEEKLDRETFQKYVKEVQALQLSAPGSKQKMYLEKNWLRYAKRNAWLIENYETSLDTQCFAMDTIDKNFVWMSPDMEYLVQNGHKFSDGTTPMWVKSPKDAKVWHKMTLIQYGECSVGLALRFQAESLQIKKQGYESACTKVEVTRMLLEKANDLYGDAIVFYAKKYGAESLCEVLQSSGLAALTESVTCN